MRCTVTKFLCMPTLEEEEKKKKEKIKKKEECIFFYRKVPNHQTSIR